MGKRKTHEEFIKEMEVKNPNIKVAMRTTLFEFLIFIYSPLFLIFSTSSAKRPNS